MLNFIITLIVASAFGLALKKLNMPGGMIIGALIGTATLNIVTANAFMPMPAKVAAQIIAGAFIGSTVKKEDVVNMKRLVAPIVLLMSVFFLFSVISGVVLSQMGYMDMLTAMMCAVPGGISDTPIVGESMGADGAVITVVQFARLISGLSIFPLVVSKITQSDRERKDATQAKKEKKPINTKNLIIALTLAAFFGVIGDISGIPAASLSFALITTATLKIRNFDLTMPMSIRYFAQILSGAYVGSSVIMSDVLALRTMVFPIIFIISGYVLISLTVGSFMSRVWKIDKAQAMLGATPAGATDMALIAADFGIDGADLVVIQVARLIIVLTIFPIALQAVHSFLSTIL